MSHKHYNPDQIQELLSNPYVAKCSPKYLTYTFECKQKAIELSMSQTLSSRDIFATLGFPSYIVHSTLPKSCVKAWKKIASERGYIGLKEGKKGRKKKGDPTGGIGGNAGTSPPITETVEYLKAKIAYLEAENHAFRLIRAGKQI